MRLKWHEHIQEQILAFHAKDGIGFFRMAVDPVILCRMSQFAMPTFRIGQKAKLRPMPSELLDLDSRGIVHIFEPPSSRARYCMGVDPTFGIPQWSRYNRSESDHLTDNGAIEIIRLGKPGFPDVQVAEYAAPIDPYDLAAVANTLGRLYSGTDENEQCLCIIEVYPGPGLPCQREMMEKYGYLHHYVWKYLDTMLPKATASYGWQSSPKSVRDLWIKGIRHISTGKITLHSGPLIEEMADCEMDMHRMSAKAVYGTHDDRVRALLMAIWAAHDWTMDVELDSTPAQINESPANWQSSDISLDRMMSAWNDRFNEISDMMEEPFLG